MLFSIPVKPINISSKTTSFNKYLQVVLVVKKYPYLEVVKTELIWGIQEDYRGYDSFPLPNNIQDIIQAGILFPCLKAKPLVLFVAEITKSCYNYVFFLFLTFPKVAIFKFVQFYWQWWFGGHFWWQTWTRCHQSQYL